MTAATLGQSGTGLEMNTYLFFVLNDHSISLSPLVSCTGYNRRLAHCDVETAPENPVDMRHGVGDVVALALSRSASQFDVDALIVLPWSHAQRRP